MVVARENWGLEVKSRMNMITCTKWAFHCLPLCEFVCGGWNVKRFANNGKKNTEKFTLEADDLGTCLNHNHRVWIKQIQTAKKNIPFF